MSSLLALLSPAKLIDDQTHYPNIPCSTPQFIDEAHYLVKKLRSLSPEQLTQILDISSKLAQETQQRHMNWQTPFSHQNAHPAIMMFQGEVYRGLKANELNSKQLQYANKHIKILSGLYGILRPLDWAMPYRLMMGTRFEVDSKTPNLYTYWQQKISTHIKQATKPNDCIINLASQEYFKCIDVRVLERRIISCEFKEKKGSSYAIVSTYAKLARGSMARFLIDHSIKNVPDIKAFNYENYQFNKHLSNESIFVFTR
jgi:cytoplasmic iron level regulating protein YaaA (DUF328/UPF0246 family)